MRTINIKFEGISYLFPDQVDRVNKLLYRKGLGNTIIDHGSHQLLIIRVKDIEGENMDNYILTLGMLIQKAIDS